MRSAGFAYAGFDSMTSLSLCAQLRALADKGNCTIICTIHQPQSKIFNLFQHLIILKAGKVCHRTMNRTYVTWWRYSILEFHFFIPTVINFSEKGGTSFDKHFLTWPSTSSWQWKIHFFNISCLFHVNRGALTCRWCIMGKHLKSWSSLRTQGFRALNTQIQLITFWRWLLPWSTNPMTASRMSTKSSDGMWSHSRWKSTSICVVQFNDPT